VVSSWLRLWNWVGFGRGVSLFLGQKAREGAYNSRGKRCVLGGFCVVRLWVSGGLRAGAMGERPGRVRNVLPSEAFGRSPWDSFSDPGWLTVRRLLVTDLLAGECIGHLALD
jgi:hypothetical protein